MAAAVVALASSRLTRIFSAFRQRIPGIQALILVHSDGTVVDECVIDRPSFEADGLTREYLPLLHIARRASEDMGSGDVSEHICITDSAIFAACRLSSNHFSIIVTSRQEHLGRLRFELRRWSGELEGCLGAVEE